MCELTCSGYGLGRCATPPPPPPVDPTADCTPDDAGTLYSGTLAQTWSGRECQAWASDVPHNHSYEHVWAPANYCRNLWGDSERLCNRHGS